MKAPTTYFEWKDLMDRFSSGDDTVLSLMNEGSITLDAGTSGRFMTLIEETYKKRKQIWIERLNKITAYNNIRSSADLSVVVSKTKSELKNLILFTGLKPLHDDFKKVLNNDLKAFVEDAKKSLCQNVMRYRTNEMNSLLLIFDNLNIDKVSTGETEVQSNPPIKKKIIF
jgi:hypothetical protein